MKTIFLSSVLCLLSSTLFADVTNTLVVVSTTAQLDIIKFANDIDNYRRTNGLPPYVVATNALNLRAFAESIAAKAIVEKAEQTVIEYEMNYSDAWRRATATQRINARQQLPP